MNIKRFFEFFLPFLFTFYSSVLSTQDTLQLQSSMSDTIISNNNSPRPEVMLQGSIEDPVVGGAEIVHQELKWSNPVLSYSGYVVATGVGLLRIYNKEHFFSEVLAGAGLGILSTKLTYWIFGKKRKKDCKIKSFVVSSLRTRSCRRRQKHSTIQNLFASEF